MAKVRIEKEAVWFVLGKIGHIRDSMSHREIISYLGITQGQWDRFITTGKLKVRPAVREKIELIARFSGPGSDPKNLPTLLKMLEAREGKP